MKLLIVLILLFFPIYSHAGKVKYRKSQEVNFDGSDVDGKVRSPDGSYLHKNRSVKFFPLYKVKEKIDKNIKDSIEYLR